MSEQEQNQNQIQDQKEKATALAVGGIIGIVIGFVISLIVWTLILYFGSMLVNSFWEGAYDFTWLSAFLTSLVFSVIMAIRGYWKFAKEFAKVYPPEQK
jgi:uncharacterized membrane protein